ncbi:MAG: AIR carboxylase family protein [Chloroflexi bacterium]|nr:AIR carboxylase family protein [Chloroflexota bacterium]MCL5074533.1 AIR carboxylase family protein [Chloroflexota bacterium]
MEPLVPIILGSSADLERGREIAEILRRFGVSSKIHIASVHKTAAHLLAMLRDYEQANKSIVYIAVAGLSNALAGMIDGHSLAPVISCPPYGERYAGLDIFSSLRMPSGIACVTVLEPEAAALAAIKILSLQDEGLRTKLRGYKQGLADEVIAADQEVGGR